MQGTVENYGLVIVLANWMDVNGILNEETRARLIQGCRIYLDGKAEKILLMGWDYRDDSSLCISDAMNEYIHKNYAISSNDILIDRKSRDTVGDAVFSKCDFSHFVENTAICVVTSDYHQLRVATIFDFVYGNDRIIDVIGINTGHEYSMSKQEKNSLEAFYSTFTGIIAGDEKMIYRAMAERHPYYNGKVHPKINASNQEVPTSK